jgi:hypothetical protein
MLVAGGRKKRRMEKKLARGKRKEIEKQGERGEGKKREREDQGGREGEGDRCQILYIGPPFTYVC